MGLDLKYQVGQTPLDEEEKDGLRIESIASKGELNEFEQHNIEEAFLWVLGRSFQVDLVLSEAFIRMVHKRMFGDVWNWAGEFRKTNKNIGVEMWQIPIMLRALLDDTKFGVEHKTYTPDEIALRFKHRLVSIHCFPNGNGRHSRLMADILIEKVFKQAVFTWGAAGENKDKNIRVVYLKALKAADKGDYNLLLKIARS